MSLKLNIDMCKFESVQKDESRAQLTDSPKLFFGGTLLQPSRMARTLASLVGNDYVLHNSINVCLRVNQCTKLFVKILISHQPLL